MIQFACCKINLGLDVLRRLPSGYHELETVMMSVPWTDVVELTPSEHTELVVTGRRVDCPAEKNLVMKAYRLLSDELGGLPPTRLQLEKIVPDGAGLGGGSSDAAYVLRGLNELYNLGLSSEQLAALASRLGADCPFFIYDTPMLCTGIGTDLQPIDLPRELHGMYIVIVKPNVSVSTAEAYAHVVPSMRETPLSERIKLPLNRWQGVITNDFEASVFPVHPQLALIKDALIEHGAVYASMSGSGSALFGLFSEAVDMRPFLPEDVTIFSAILG